MSRDKDEDSYQVGEVLFYHESGNISNGSMGTGLANTYDDYRNLGTDEKHARAILKMALSAPTIFRNIKDKCYKCGDGIFNICDKLECESLANCEFKSYHCKPSILYS